MSDQKYKVASRFCPFSKECCDKRCPAWVERVLSTENINTNRGADGFCTKLENFDEEGRLIV